MRTSEPSSFALFVHLLEEWGLATSLRDAMATTSAAAHTSSLRGLSPLDFSDVPLELTAPAGHFRRNLAPFLHAARTGAPVCGVTGEKHSEHPNTYFRGLSWRPTRGLSWRPTQGRRRSVAQRPPARWRVMLTVREDPCYADECLPCELPTT